MAAGKVAHVTLKGPSVVKEILTAMGVALFAGSFWKMHQWNEQRKVRAFYDLLEKGEIGVVVQEKEGKGEDRGEAKYKTMKEAIEE
ncbi:Cytochrome c oxidase subunit 5C, partial [Cucurbita argyrosperma subsp. argyrosperma]